MSQMERNLIGNQYFPQTNRPIKRITRADRVPIVRNGDSSFQNGYINNNSNQRQFEPHYRDIPNVTTKLSESNPVQKARIYESQFVKGLRDESLSPFSKTKTKIDRNLEKKWSSHIKKTKTIVDDDDSFVSSIKQWEERTLLPSLKKKDSRRRSLLKRTTPIKPTEEATSVQHASKVPMTINTSPFWITDHPRRRSSFSSSTTTSSSTNSANAPASPLAIQAFQDSYMSKSPTPSNVTQYMHRVWENESRLRSSPSSVVSPPKQSLQQRAKSSQRHRQRRRRRRSSGTSPIKKKASPRYSQSYVEFERRRSVEIAYAPNETSFEGYRFREGYTAANTEPPSILYNSPLLRGQTQHLYKELNPERYPLSPDNEAASPF